MAFSEVGSRPPNRQELEWALWVTVFEIFVLNQLLNSGQLRDCWNKTLMNRLGNGLKSWVGIVTVEQCVADKFSKLY